MISVRNFRTGTAVLTGLVLLLVTAGSVRADMVVGPGQKIEDAVAQAMAGEVVVVLPGSYFVDDPNGIDFAGKAMTLRSKKPQDANTVSSTIIDCMGLGRAFNFHSGEGPDSVVMGFTIKNGYREGPRGADASVPGAKIDPTDPNSPVRAHSGGDASGDSYGGGIYCENSNPSISYCVVTNCEVRGATGGNGARGKPGRWDPNDPNAADGQWGGHGGKGEGSGYGGAIYLKNSSPMITNCVISANRAFGGFGGAGGDGGDGSLADPNTGAEAGRESSGGNGGEGYGDGYGAGIYCDDKSSPLLMDCVFTNNYASSQSYSQTGPHGAPGGRKGAGEANDKASPGKPGFVSGDGYGGAVYYGSGCSVFCVNVTMTANSAWSYTFEVVDDQNEVHFEEGYGGGIYCTDDVLLMLLDSTIENSNGGGVYCEGGTMMEITGCRFTNNKGALDGGGLSNGSGGSGTLTDCTFSGNTTSGYGGGMYCLDNSLTFTNCVFTQNNAGGGAGLYSENGDTQRDGLTFTDCTFSGNQASEAFEVTGHGGGIYAEKNAITMTGCAVSGNSGQDGGGMCCESGCTLQLSETDFLSNTAKGGGGGAFLYSFDANVVECYFLGNKARDGGALNLWYAGSTTVLTRCIIKGNLASGTEGGGVYALTAPVTIRDSVISDNSVPNAGGAGGGLSFWLEFPVVTNCLLTGNSAGSLGGAISFTWCEAAVNNCTISGNTAGDAGGGIFCALLASVTVGDCIFDGCNNHAIYEDDEDCDVAVTYSLFHGNADGDFFDEGKVSLTGATAINSFVDGASNNIGGDPLFVSVPGGRGDYFLSQLEAGQGANSPAVNAGSATAESLELDGYTTRTDNGFDSGKVDIGYHYTDIALVRQHQLTVIVVESADGEIHGSVEPNTGTYFPGVVVGLTATPETMETGEDDYKLTKWTGTDNDSSTLLTNTVTMTKDRVVYVEFKKVRKISPGVPGSHDYMSIQKAINLAEDGDIILLSPTEYPGTGFEINKNITISGIKPGDPCTVAQTVINCEGEDPPGVGYGFVLRGHGGGSVVLKGITIVNSNTTTPHIYIHPSGGSPGGSGRDNYGGGIIVLGDHKIMNCNIRNCSLGVSTAQDGSDGADGEFDLPRGGDGGYGGDAYGAGIYVSYGSPTIVNCKIENCRAEAGHAGSAGNGLENSEETGMSAAYGGRGGDGGSAMGAGIYLRGGGSPLIKNCKIVGCEAIAGNAGNGGNGGNGARGGDGGEPGRAAGAGVYCDSGTKATFINCTIRNCRATGGTGGDGGDATLPQEIPIHRDGGVGGLAGVLSGWGMDASLYSAVGGGVYCGQNTEATFINCTFSGNMTDGGVSGIGGFDTFPTYQQQPRRPYNVPSYGGGVHCEENSTATFTDCTFERNVATFHGVLYSGYGGALNCDEGAHVTIIGGSFRDNSSPVGGAVHWLGSYLTIRDSDFSNNMAYEGGGIDCIDSPLSTIDNCTITGNEGLDTVPVEEPNEPDGAPDGPDDDPPGDDPNDPNAPYRPTRVCGEGGGIFCVGSNALFSNCVIRGNRSTGSGGGAYLGGSPVIEIPGLGLELKNCLVVENLAARDGGGLTCDWHSEPVISNCTIAYNRVTGGPFEGGAGGGLSCSYKSKTKVIDSIIWGNLADFGSQIGVGSADPNMPLCAKLTVSYSDIHPAESMTFTPVAADEVPVIRPGFDSQALPKGDDVSSDLVNIGFGLDYFGVKYSQLYVNNNGNVTFDANMLEFTPFGLTSNIGTAIIAPFLADVDTRAELVPPGEPNAPVNVNGEVTYGMEMVDGHIAFGVTWNRVGYASRHADKVNTFQLVLIDRSDRATGDFDIEFNYERIKWESGDASGGEEGLGGDSARAGFSKGTGEAGTFYEFGGSGVNGAFLNSSQRGLIHRSRNSVVGGRYIFAVRNGIVEMPYGRTIYVEEGCTLNWDPAGETWDPDSHNIEENPLFVDGYRLSQVAAGQSADSKCVDAGSTDARFVDMNKYTTRTDGIIDTGIVDMGYHYPTSMTGIVQCDFNFDGNADLADLAIFAWYWLEESCSEPEWCEGTDLDFDSDVDFVDYAIFAQCYAFAYEPPLDTSPPQPNPSTWAVVPYAISPDSISMTATEASDQSGVLYYFECTDGFDAGGNDSGWQENATYVDTGVSVGAVRYCYTVRTRDMARGPDEGNEGLPSVERCVGIDNDPPSPDPMTWEPGGEPTATSPYSITMTASKATDMSGVEYGFVRSDGPDIIHWQIGQVYEDTGLDESTMYCYRVLARDRSVNQTETQPSVEVCVTTPADTEAPKPDPSTWAVPPHAISATQVSMTATEADDPSGVEYGFIRSDEPGVIHWQDTRDYLDTVPLGGPGTYCYTVITRDKSALQNETAPSVEICVAMPADGEPPQPDPPLWETKPFRYVDDGKYYDYMKAKPVSDPSGVQYGFMRDDEPAVIHWQDSREYTVEVEDSFVQYYYRIKARDKVTPFPNETGWSDWVGYPQP